MHRTKPSVHLFYFSTTLLCTFVPELNWASPGITNCNHEEEITVVSAHLLHIDTPPHTAWSWKGRCEGCFPLIFLSLSSESHRAMGAKCQQLRQKEIKVHWQKMVAGCKGGWLYPQIYWFLCRRSLSSVCLGVRCDAHRMVWGHGSSKAHKGTSEAHPYQWPWAHFLSTLLSTQSGSGVLHVLGFFRSRFLHVWHSLQKKLIKWWDGSSYANQKQEGKRFAGTDLP